MPLRLIAATALIAATTIAWADKPEVPAHLRTQVHMTPVEGLTDYPTLSLDALPVTGGRHYVAGWSRPLGDINQIGGLVVDDSGYTVAGTTLHAEDVRVRFNRDAVADLMNSPFSVATHGDEVFSTPQGRDIAVSLMHFTPDGERVWVSTFENDLVSAGPLTRLPDGRLLFALTPLVIDDGRAFSSFLFLISPDGAVLHRTELKDVLINGLLTTADGQVLAGVVRREVRKGEAAPGLRQYAWFLDAKGQRRRQQLLAEYPGDRLVYKVLSLIQEYDDAYVLSGGDSVFILDKHGGEPKQVDLHPSVDRYADYYIQAVHRDRQHNLIMLGFHGREKSPLMEMKLNYLQSVTRPTTPGQELSAANMRMHDNPMLRGIYDEMLNDLRAQTRERGIPFNAVFTPEEELINLIDPKERSTQHTMTGTGSDDGSLLIERIRNGMQTGYELLNPNGQLLIRAKAPAPFCAHACRLHGSTLVYLLWSQEQSAYYLQQGEFAPDSAE